MHTAVTTRTILIFLNLRGCGTNTLLADYSCYLAHSVFNRTELIQ